MSDALQILQRLVDVLLGLTCLGAPFLVWNRSKNAALLGAASGAVYLFAIVVDFALEHLHGSGPTPVGVRLAFTLIAGLRNLLFYGCLFGALLTLARGNATPAVRS